MFATSDGAINCLLGSGCDGLGITLFKPLAGLPVELYPVPAGFGLAPVGFGLAPVGFGLAPGFGRAPAGFGRAPVGFGLAPAGFGLAPAGFGLAPGFGRAPAGFGRAPAPRGRFPFKAEFGEVNIDENDVAADVKPPITATVGSLPGFGAAAGGLTTALGFDAGFFGFGDPDFGAIVDLVGLTFAFAPG